MLTFSFMFIAIVLAGVFLMAPEYAHLVINPQARLIAAAGKEQIRRIIPSAGG